MRSFGYILLILILALVDIDAENASGTLQYSFETKNRISAIGEYVVFTLRFENRGNTPIRIYFIENEVFRAAQSMLCVRRVTDGKVVEILPLPKPHGYRVDESDFHLISPGGIFTALQTLRIDTMKFKSGEEYEVNWIYENQIKNWTGERFTQDGKTKRLFDGKEIPYIWTGRWSTRQRIWVK